MRKKNLLIFLLISSNYISAQIFKQPYYFIGQDEMHVFTQSNDTLYASTTFSLEHFNIEKYKKHYKIRSVNENQSELLIVKLESLDSILLTTDPYPEDRFKISVYQRKNEKEITLIKDIEHLTKERMEHYHTDSIKSNDNVGMNLYSLSYMKELLNLKKVKSKKDMDKINQELNHPKYLEFLKNYIKQSKLSDPYASILNANLINSACLNLGYSPIGASFIMGIIKSNKSREKKEKIINEFYSRINP